MESGEMTFWDHLESLRWVLMRIVAALGVAAIAAFSVMPWLFDNFVLAQTSGDLLLYRLQ